MDLPDLPCNNAYSHALNGFEAGETWLELIESVIDCSDISWSTIGSGGLAPETVCCLICWWLKNKIILLIRCWHLTQRGKMATHTLAPMSWMVPSPNMIRKSWLPSMNILSLWTPTRTTSSQSITRSSPRTHALTMVLSDLHSALYKNHRDDSIQNRL